MNLNGAREFDEKIFRELSIEIQARKTERQTDIQTDRHKERQTQRKTDTKKDRHKERDRHRDNIKSIKILERSPNSLTALKPFKTHQQLAEFWISVG